MAMEAFLFPIQSHTMQCWNLRGVTSQRNPAILEHIAAGMNPLQ